MGVLHRVWLAACLAVIVGPSAVAVWLPGEAWPWTCAPMFAEPHGDDTRYYVPVLVVERPDGTEVTFDSRDVRISEWHFERLLFMKAYGSVTPDSPFRYLPDDTPAAFDARMDAFFDVTVAHVLRKKLPRNPKDMVGLRLELHHVGSGTRADRVALKRKTAPITVVGHYDVKKRTFTRTPR